MPAFLNTDSTPVTIDEDVSSAELDEIERRHLALAHRDDDLYGDLLR